jgi:cytochrome c oxidase subunit III
LTTVAETAHHEAPASIGHDHHSSNVHHQFEDLEQQHHADMLGMWLFLGTEVMFFGGLIGAYLVYRFTTPDVWAAASKNGLNLWLGTFNTFVLLTSSLAMALAVHHGETGDRKGQVRGLLLTMALGLAFLGIKSCEYYLEYREGLIPGANFSAHHLHLPTDEDPSARSAEEAAEVAVTTKEAAVLSIPLKTFAERRAQLFFVFYFTMTGLHFLHMVIGIVLLIIILQMARRGRFTPEYHNPLEIAGLYWHFIDIVWVFLYPLLYLVALHK